MLQLHSAGQPLSYGNIAQTLAQSCDGDRSSVAKLPPPITVSSGADESISENCMSKAESASIESEGARINIGGPVFGFKAGDVLVEVETSLVSS